MPGLDRLGRPVLVLNASYEPINVCAARRALVLVLKGVATAEEHAPLAIHSARHAIKVPSVIRLLEYRRIPHQTRALSRKNILMRDRYTCQYCLKTMNSGESGGVLPSLQQQEGEPYTRRSRNAPDAPAQTVQPAYQPPPDAPARQE